MTSDHEPDTTERTRLQAALLDNEAAWRWYLLGYERGIETGHNVGAQDIINDLKCAGRELAELMPAVRRQIDVNTHRARKETT